MNNFLQGFSFRVINHDIGVMKLVWSRSQTKWCSIFRAKVRSSYICSVSEKNPALIKFGSSMRYRCS